MPEKPEENKDRLKDVVQSRIKGLGLDALFHQVDVTKKDDGSSRTGQRGLDDTERKLLEKLKRGLVMTEKKGRLASWSEKIKNLLSAKTPTQVILDVGSSAIKIAEIKRLGGKLTLSRASHISIPHIVTTSREKLEQFQTDALTQALEAYPIRTALVSTLLARSVAIAKFISLPTHQEEEIKKMLAFETEHHLPFPLSEVETDHQVTEQQTNASKLVLVAVKKEEIAKHLTLLKRIGVQPDTIAISAFALYNSALSGLNNQGVFVQIHIGAASTDINIIKDTRLSLSRGINWGSGDLTLNLSQNLHLSFEDAEKIKKENGILLTKKFENPTKKAISDVATSWADFLIHKINRTIESFKLREGPLAIDQILLSGGGCKLLNLNEYLKDKLKIKISIQKNPSHIHLAQAPETYHKYAQEFNLLLGLAWTGFGRQPLEINLLPQKIKRSLTLKKQKTRQRILIGGIIGCLCLLFILPAALMNRRNGQIRNLQRQRQELKAAVASVSALEDKIQTIEDYISTRQSCTEILKEISLVVTTDITIDEFSFEKDVNVELTGTAQSHASAVNFSKALSESRFFESSKLRRTRRKGVPGEEFVDFEILCTLSQKKEF